MLARLPNTAQVKCWRGGVNGNELPLSELIAGDMVIGYDVVARDLVVLTLRRVEPLPAQPVISYFLQHYRWCNFFHDTEAFTVHGLAPMASSPNTLMSYCVVNPKRLVVKVPVDMMESGPTPGFLLEWDDTALLWSEGLLVGTSNLPN